VREKKEVDKKFVCKHITIRPDQNERIRNWPHGVLSKLTQDVLDVVSDEEIEENYLKRASRKKLLLKSRLDEALNSKSLLQDD
jgi:hypothetical protein